MSAPTTQSMTLAVVHPSVDSVASGAADLIEEHLGAGCLQTLGVATGSSASPVYRELARRRLSLADVTLFALDEYLGLPFGHPQSYRAVLEREVAEPLGIPFERVNVPDGRDPESYERLIAHCGGVDLQLLGIGRNGHIGFNEPGSPFDSSTRIVDLDESTREANARFFRTSDEVPRQSVTQGIATILRARRLLVVACGAEKAPVVAAALNGPRAEEMPASVLRDHPDVTWLIDHAAASLLPGFRPSTRRPAEAA